MAPGSVSKRNAVFEIRGGSFYPQSLSHCCAEDQDQVGDVVFSGGVLFSFWRRSQFPKIHSYTTPEDLEAFTHEAPVTKSGATLTYGPYNNIPASTNKDFVKGQQKRITVHYEYGNPILELTKLERTAEISHWGSNLNIQDNVWLHNAGPK